jgi:hypothetical protein
MRKFADNWFEKHVGLSIFYAFKIHDTLWIDSNKYNFVESNIKCITSMFNKIGRPSFYFPFHSILLFSIGPTQHYYIHYYYTILLTSILQEMIRHTRKKRLSIMRF